MSIRVRNIIKTNGNCHAQAPFTVGGMLVMAGYGNPGPQVVPLGRPAQRFTRWWPDYVGAALPDGVEGMSEWLLMSYARDRQLHLIDKCGALITRMWGS